jgi:BioD-like phosphotransacetylase family protein
MARLVVASTRRSAGKTSAIVGIAKAAGKRIGYIKPFGDRLLYSKKRLWDYDAALMTNVFGLTDNVENMNVGFDHSKLRYMYDEKRMGAKLSEMVGAVEKDKDIVFVEGGPSFAYGSSVYLDPISVAKTIKGRFAVVVGGEENMSLDHLTFLKRHVDMNGVDFAGIIMNKVKNIEEFQGTHLPKITGMGMKVLGVLPYEEKMTHLSLGYLAEQLFARVVTGEGEMKRVVKTIFIGAMSANAALQHPLFKKENKLVITSGDRSDMILAAIENNAECVVLTGNILPPTNIISKASERGIPLLSVPFDTYDAAKKIEGIEPLLTKDDSERITLLGKMAKELIDLDALVG